MTQRVKVSATKPVDLDWFLAPSDLLLLSYEHPQALMPGGRFCKSNLGQGKNSTRKLPLKVQMSVVLGEGERLHRNTQNNV